jgi:hypothetical protein
MAWGFRDAMACGFQDAMSCGFRDAINGMRLPRCNEPRRLPQTAKRKGPRPRKAEGMAATTTKRCHQEERVRRREVHISFAHLGAPRHMRWARFNFFIPQVASERRLGKNPCLPVMTLLTEDSVLRYYSVFLWGAVFVVDKYFSGALAVLIVHASGRFNERSRSPLCSDR